MWGARSCIKRAPARAAVDPSPPPRPRPRPRPPGAGRAAPQRALWLRRRLGLGLLEGRPVRARFLLLCIRFAYTYIYVLLGACLLFTLRRRRPLAATTGGALLPVTVGQRPARASSPPPPKAHHRRRRRQRHRRRVHARQIRVRPCARALGGVGSGFQTLAGWFARALRALRLAAHDPASQSQTFPVDPAPHNTSPRPNARLSSTTINIQPNSTHQTPGPPTRRRRYVENLFDAGCGCCIRLPANRAAFVAAEARARGGGGGGGL